MQRYLPYAPVPNTSTFSQYLPGNAQPRVPPSPPNASLNNSGASSPSVASSSGTTSGSSVTATFPQQDNEDVAIAVMGATGSGKTTFINLVTGSTLRVGKGLESCTNVVQTSHAFELGGRWVTLIDTPGFDDTHRSDADVLKMIAAYLETTYKHGKKLAGVIYIHRISDFRMGGVSTRNFSMFRKLCGDSTLRNVVIVTNMGGEVSREVGEAREYELATEEMFFKPVLDNGAQLLRHENTRDSAQAILNHIIGNRPLPLQIQRELVDEHKTISQTAAGAELSRELMAQAERHREEMRKLQIEIQSAMEAKDMQTRSELEAEYRKMDTKMKQVQDDAAKLTTTYNDERVKLEQKMQQVEEATRREAEKAAEEHRRQMQEMQRRLESLREASAAAERDSTRRQMDDMERRYQQDCSKRRSSGGFGLFGFVGGIIDRWLGTAW